MNKLTSETRRESYEKTLAKLGPLQREVLEAIRFSFDGLTAWELSEKLNHFVHAIRPRLTELQNLGLIAASSAKLHELTGRREAVWLKVETKIDKDGQILML